MVYIHIYVIYFTILYGIQWTNNNFITVLLLTDIWIIFQLFTITNSAEVNSLIWSRAPVHFL